MGLRSRRIEAAYQVLVSGLQWVLFLVSSHIVFPVVVAGVYNFNGEQTAELIQRTILLMGVGTLFQFLWGHKLILAEGISGVWWSMFLILGSAGASVSQNVVLAELEGALIVSGIALLFVSVFGFLKKIIGLFSPLVTGVYLILLSIQVSGPFVTSMLGTDEGEISIKVTILSFSIAGLVYILSNSRKDFLKKYAALFGIITGWIVFTIMGLEGPVSAINRDSLFYLPKFFAWGYPQIDLGIVLIALITPMILVSNIVASVKSVAEVTGRSPSDELISRASSITGICNILAGALATVGTIPAAVCAGFIKLTNSVSRWPFLFGGALLIIVGITWPIGIFLSRIPQSIACAVSLLTFGQMLSIGLSNLKIESQNEKSLIIIGLSIISGCGFMFIPPDVYKPLPPLLQNFLSSGMLIGTCIAILMEQIFLKREKS
jgi:xanthine/uracil permease